MTTSWLIGYLFTIGLVAEDCQKEKWWVILILATTLLALWPVALGDYTRQKFARTVNCK